jgi:hypothetical protein
LDGKDYTIARIANSMIILRSSDAREQEVVVAGIDYPEGFFKKKEEEVTKKFD